LFLKEIGKYLTGGILKMWKIDPGGITEGHAAEAGCHPGAWAPPRPGSSPDGPQLTGCWRG